ncbi:Polyketide synthase PksM [Legionella massiliensis]|uniref:Polyketide synthase PksM n=1 Tax=Legionella massiliensis TaxID=1034943 RepID=A0A078KWK8_9GAMM|nr:SDR family NAD(P)-dependent oxidoreductase [Legionella massiliensis]CDZ78850.1 Polyketide synthase PksM [Legionella massiliensis]CEE14588.1 Polyketide synthase PksM [Legionella massiliensis]
MPKNEHCDMNEPIAIVGVNCQFPGINQDIEDVNAFFDMLLKAQTPIKEVPKNRWDIDSYYDADRQKEDKIVCRKGGFMEDPKLFDAAFFKISPLEAKQIDPQHRLFLEIAIRALNDANITLESLKNSNTGVYCGLSTHDYSQLNYKDNIQFNAYTYIGSAASAAAGRLSYFLNLKGPAITVDTACSSSLAALYLAVTALKNKQCDMAIVGGVHLSLCPEVWIGLSKANMISAVGESRSFDANADGYVRSEGCAVVVLKRLDDALKDQNKIQGVIKGIVMNQDGGGMGMAAPNVEAQVTMHHSVLESAHLSATDIDYIETHGTGTILGDSSELEAIQSIHQGKHSKDNPLIIGALKSNLGHTISASGIAALVKVIASFKQEMIPANLHYSTANGAVDPDSIPALFPVQARPFPKRSDKKRYVQISNFGFTGTNVSAIIEEPPTIPVSKPSEEKGDAACFVISANSEFSLRQMLKSHLHYLQTSEVSFYDLCHTLINCRDHYKFRCAIIAQDKESLIKKIESSYYAIKKTSIEKEPVLSTNDAQQDYESFLSGANLRSKAEFNPVDLPLYVFDRKAYWHEARTTAGHPEHQEMFHYVRHDVDEDWSFKLEWQQQPIDKNNYRESGQRWLLVGEEQGDFGLKEKGLTIIRESDNYSLEELDGIIFAEGFNSPLSEDIDLQVDWQKNSLKKILFLLKTLTDKALKLRLVFLTDDAAELVSSPLKGFCKTLCLELPQFQTILIDLDNRDAGNFAEQILDEMKYNHGQSYDHIVAYREGKRRVSYLKPTPLPERNLRYLEQDLCHPERREGSPGLALGHLRHVERRETSPGLAPCHIQEMSHYVRHGIDGRYLITGGCGGLGLITAQALLAAGARELVLVSRTVDEPTILATIKKLQANYPESLIRPMSVDISDKASLQKLLESINEDGLLKGIVHAAGASLNKSLLEHQERDIDQVFSAKVKGGWYLHELSKNYDLDFFIVYSSISSVFGSNKESVYSATNSFLDGLISERRRLGLVGTAIQWGPWAEVGMAKKRSQDQGLKEALIHNEQGQAFIQRLLNSELSHVTVISPAYLQFMLDFVPEPKPAFHKSLLADLRKVAPSPTQDLGLSPWLTEYSKVAAGQQFTTCKSMLSKICRALLEIDDTEDLDADAGFFDIGLDSLMMAELATRLKKQLQPLLPVVATIAFDYPSINQLAEHLQSELGQHFLKTPTANEPSEPLNDAIAIIGMSCSLPNAPDLAGFEQLLEEGLSGIKEIPLERWDNQLYYDPNPDAPGKTYVNKLGLVDNIKSFDPEFFGISPREAPFLDPQQRLFLENCYHALENANYRVQSLRGSSTGVYAGVGSSHEYYTLLEKRGFANDELGMFSVTGKALNIIPGRVAYAFDFKGPALSIDTACSSSLVAIHYACNSLKNHEIDFALAGGVNILLRPDGLINLSKAKALSADGQCKTFDARADGYVRSEGCGVVFLKRMSDALRDKDRILAVIKGSAINNDGKCAGLTVPNGKSQEEVMNKALSQAQLSANDINYIEAHGTGTVLGDPIEVHAINAVYGKERAKDNPLYIGTVKTNIGHLESAAGVAGLIKVILGLQKKRIYKNLNFNRLNPNINLDSTQIALDNREWQSKTGLKSAGVSAFGFSGTNAHIILQEFPENVLAKEAFSHKTKVLVLSAKSQTSLDNLVQRYQQFLETTKDDFNNLCFTAAMYREHYPYRLAIAAKDSYSASQLLKRGEFATSDQKNKSLDLDEDVELNLLVSDFLQGKQVDWASYYQAAHYSKVTLPEYPFARNEYWLDTTDRHRVQKDDNEPAVDSVSYDSAIEHLYEVKWIPVNTDPLSGVEVPDLWVISTNVLRVKRVLGFLKYQLIDHIDQVAQLEGKHLVFLYEEGQFQELFHCCQRMFKSLPASFVLVTEHAYTISDSEPINPHHSLASTFWKSFKNELEFNRNYAVDLDDKRGLTTSLEYLFNTANEETQVVVRDAIYVPRLKKKTLIIEPIQQLKTLFDPEASYLITGGTGGLAKPLVEYLMCNGVKQLVITSRSECSLDTQNWIDSLRKKGVSLSHYAADAANLGQMERVIEGIQQSAHPLKGVFHLAGIVRNNLIVDLTEEELQDVFRAKMESALILHQLTKTLPLDLFVLFSSASSILGSRRQANYAAANGFLDGLAHLRRQLGLPALAINWGVFHSIGMAAGQFQSLQKRGFILLDQTSIAILDLLLRSDLSQIVVCPMHWDLYFKNMPKDLEFSELNEASAPATKQSFLSFLQQHSQKEQGEILGQVLSSIAADVLGFASSEQLSKKKDLFTLGMDSLMSLELRSRVHDKLQCPELNLPIEYFISDPSIDKITSNIAKELNKYFAQDQRQTPAENSRVGAIALSDTQYGFWVVNKMGFSFNCPRQIQFKGQLNPDYLYKALAFTINNNGVFWLNFHKDIPIQVSKRQGQFSWIYEDLCAEYDQDAMNELFYINTMEPVPLVEQPLIRVCLFKLKEDLHELHIIIPHIILDGSSYRIFLEQLKNNYETLVLGKNLIPVQEQYSYLDYVKQNNSRYETDLESKIDFWQVYNSGFQKLSFGRNHHLPDAANQPKNLFNYLLEESFVEKFKEWHKEKNINVSTGLIAAVHIVFYKLSSQKKIPIMVLHNDREGSRYDSVVGLLIDYKRINISLDENYTFIEFFRSIENEFIKAAPFQKCAQYIKNSGLKESLFSPGLNLITLYYKLLLSKKFKVSYLNSTLRSYYLKGLGNIRLYKTKLAIRNRLSQLLHINLRLLKPQPLTVVFNITQGFFIKEPRDTRFADLEVIIPNHYGSVDRPIGNQTLWIFFTKDQYDQYRLSLNGPLTPECKDLIAEELIKVMTKVMENDEYRIRDFL